MAAQHTDRVDGYGVMSRAPAVVPAIWQTAASAGRGGRETGMRVLKWMGIGLLVVVLVIAAVWTGSRMRGPTPVQEAALARMDAPNAFEGRNAFDAAWVLQYDVPDSDVSAVVDADMAALAAVPLGRSITLETRAAAYADLRPADGALRPCSSAGGDCLREVRGDLDGYTALVADNARLIERVEALSRYDHLASRLPARADAPLPPLQLLAWPLTAHAVRFARAGDMDAVAATCRDLATMRRLGVNSDLLIMRMVGIAFATDGYGRLLVDMLHELPRDRPLPVECEVALRPPMPQEASVCTAIRGEFAWSAAAIQASALDTGASRWFLDPQATRFLLAENLASPCGDATAAALAEDRPVSFVQPGPWWRRRGCLANAAGCILADIPAPAYATYAHRAQDQNARLQLLATLAWLRAQPDDGTLAERIARRPAALRSPARDIEVTDDGRALRIAQYDTARGEFWSLPLPDYLALPASPD